tara:strand:- start:10442 stop:11164 length:723 start_codon:yes stop_codon:yes gene_type:complete
MPIRKNIKRIDPRYFLNETVTRDCVEVFYETSARTHAQRQKMLREASSQFQIGPEGVSGKIQAIGPWGALVAVSATAAYSALNIAALNATTATGVAFFLSTSAIPLMLAGAFAWASIKAKIAMPKWMKRVFNMFSKKEDPLQVAQNSIRDSISQIVDQTNMSKQEAKSLMQIVNDAVHNDKDCKDITERLLLAIEKQDADDTAALTVELDESVAHVFESLMEQLKEMSQSESSGQRPPEI